MAPPDPSRALALPVDELALEVLADLVATNQWNEYNYLNSTSQNPRSVELTRHYARSPRRSHGSAPAGSSRELRARQPTPPSSSRAPATPR